MGLKAPPATGKPMYESFFHLSEKPFNLTPSHRFLYLSEGHKEALALLTYGVVERKGFILLTGDVGTGKTTIIQVLLNNLGTDVECIHVSNPLLSPREFIDYLASSTFKRRVHFKSKTDFLFEFEDYLKEAQQHQRAFVLIIDEAQALSMDLLEEIRLLSNLESSEEKLINIFLVGQPELLERLQDPRCRALHQRIASRYHLEPLTEEETGSYVTRRLEVAGAAKPRDIFPKRTIKALYEHSQGFPRIINVLADNALLLGYSVGKQTITPKMVQDCHRDMHMGEGSRAEEKELKSEAGPEPRPDEPKRKGQKLTLRRALGWVLALLVLLGLGVLLNDVTVPDFSALGGFLRQEPSPPEPVGREEEPEAPPTSIQERPPDSPEQAGSTESAPVNDETEPAASPPGPEEVRGELTLPSPAELEGEGQGTGADSAGGVSGGESLAGVTGATRVAVKEGDYLAKLALEVYGRADEEILALIQRNNPDLRDVHRIAVGQVLVFPELPGASTDRIYTVHVASYRPGRSARDTFRALSEAGYEVFMVPFRTAEQGTLHRITVGSFSEREAARTYARDLRTRPEFTYAEVIQLNMNERGP